MGGRQGDAASALLTAPERLGALTQCSDVEPVHLPAAQGLLTAAPLVP